MLTLDAIRAECAALGMSVDEEGATLALVSAETHCLTQVQFDAALRLHARRVKHLFTPANYTWKQRLGLACHFLFNPRRWR